MTAATTPCRRQASPISGRSVDWVGSIHRQFRHVPYLSPSLPAHTLHRPDSIPHLSQQVSNSSETPRGSVTGGPALHPTHSQGQAGSPVKESSILQRGMSVDEQDGAEIAKELEKKGVAPTSNGSGGETDPKGMPIRSS